MLGILTFHKPTPSVVPAADQNSSPSSVSSTPSSSSSSSASSSSSSSPSSSSTPAQPKKVTGKFNVLLNIKYFLLLGLLFAVFVCFLCCYYIFIVLMFDCLNVFVACVGTLKLSRMGTQLLESNITPSVPSSPSSSASSPVSSKFAGRQTALQGMRDVCVRVCVSVCSCAYVSMRIVVIVIHVSLVWCL